MNDRESAPSGKPRSTAELDVAEEQQGLPEAGGREVGAQDRMARVLDSRQRLGSELLFRTSGGRQGTPPAERLAAQRLSTTRLMRAPLQLRAAPAGGEAAAEHPGAAQAVADEGMSGGATALPHQDAIQRSFGRHDVSHIQAHAGAEADAATAELGAKAYASGDRVAFGGGGAPDLHTAAHEAAHVVQQQGGVQLAGGVGRDGDEHERHADAVADRVVKGQSAEALLDAAPGRGGAPGHGVQRSSSSALQLAKPANKAAAQGLAGGATAKKPPKLKKGQRAGGFPFGNYEGKLPKQDGAAKAITYTEYDVNGYDGKGRDAERVVTGSDGRCWYTSDHYKSFVELK